MTLGILDDAGNFIPDGQYRFGDFADGYQDAGRAGRSAAEIKQEVAADTARSHPTAPTPLRGPVHPWAADKSECHGGEKVCKKFNLDSPPPDGAKLPPRTEQAPRAGRPLPYREAKELAEREAFERRQRQPAAEPVAPTQQEGLKFNCNKALGPVQRKDYAACGLDKDGNVVSRDTREAGEPHEPLRDRMKGPRYPLNNVDGGMRDPEDYRRQPDR